MMLMEINEALHTSTFKKSKLQINSVNFAPEELN
jgi:hypothetical protein